MQHSPVVDSVFGPKLIFVLEYIADAAERKRLHAEFKLLVMSAPATMFCTSSDPRQWKIPPDLIYSQNNDGDVSFCFPDPRNIHE